MPTATDISPSSSRLQWAVLAIGLLATLTACYGIATETLVVGSAAGRWVYRYAHPFGPRQVAIALGVSAIAIWLLSLTDKWLPRRPWLLVGLWIGFACAAHVALRSLTPFSMEAIFASDGANAFDGVARRYYAATVLRDFDHVRAYWPTHAQSNMPGKLMLVYALRNISTRVDVLPWLVVAVSNVGGILLYGLARDLFADRKVALYSLVLYLFVPARLFFFPLLNTVTPVILFGCLWLLLRWLRLGSAAYAAALGVALYGLVFYEPLPLVMGLLFLALAVRAIGEGTITLTRFALHCVVVVAGFAVADAAVRLAFGFDLVRALQQIAAHAVAFNANEERPYGVWVIHNLREFALGAGPGQIVLVISTLAGALVAATRGHATSAAGLRHPATIVALGAMAVLLVTDAIGINRGEVIRLWIFLACVFQIPAAYACARLGGPAMALLLTATILLCALGTAMIGFIVPG